jgi:hypothetical protein
LGCSEFTCALLTDTRPCLCLSPLTRMCYARTGCYSVPYLLNDMTTCCDAHDFCYGSCGVTQAFCDEQLHQCMEAHASFPSCQASIDTADLAVRTLGCSHFTAAQDESVQHKCQNPGPHNGCVQPCSDIDSCLETLDSAAHTVVGGINAILASPVGNAVCTGIDVIGTLGGVTGICHGALAAVKTVAEGASAVIHHADTVVSWVKKGLDFLGRRLAEGCPPGARPNCHATLQRIQNLEKKLNAAQGLISTATSLAVLSSQLTDPSSSTSPVTLAKLDMSFLDLDMLNDEVLSNALLGAAGDSSNYRVEVRQLVTLIRTKLEQIRAYNEAALSKKNNEQQRDLLGRRAKRTADLVATMNDESQKQQAAIDVLEAKVRGFSHVQLQYLLEQARAFEYLFLTDFHGIDLDQLRSRRLTATEYQHYLSDAHLQLTRQFTDVASRYSQGRDQKTSHTTIQFADIPAQRDEFHQTGRLTVSLTLPVGTSWNHVTFVDVSVFLLGLSSPSGTQQTVNINLVRGGVSTFIDRGNQTRRFTTEDSNPPMSFS